MVLKRFENHNDTNQQQTAHFTARQNYTRNFTVGASVSVAAKAAIFAEIKAQIDSSVSKSVSTGYDNTQDLKIPAHRVGHGNFGIFHRKAYGKSYYVQSNCDITNKTWTKARAPKAEGWRVWITRN